jgi:hypothetical protein
MSPADYHREAAEGVGFAGGAGADPCPEFCSFASWAGVDWLLRDQQLVEPGARAVLGDQLAAACGPRSRAALTALRPGAPPGGLLAAFQPGRSRPDGGTAVRVTRIAAARAVG